MSLDDDRENSENEEPVEREEVQRSELPDPEEEEAAKEHRKRRYYYRHPFGGLVQIEGYSVALQRLLARLREAPETTDLSDWIQHYHDDRLYRAIQIHERALQEESDHAARKQQKADVVRDLQRKLLSDEIAEVEAEINALTAELTARNTDLETAEHEAAEYAAAAGLSFSPQEKQSQEELRDATKDKRRLRRFMSEVRNRFRTVMRKLRRKPAEPPPEEPYADPARAEHLARMSTADKGDPASASSEVITKALQAGRHGGYNVGIIPPIGMPIRPEEAAADLGVPYYRQHEVTEDDLDHLQKENRTLPLQHLKLQVHIAKDRRFDAPIIRQGLLKTFGWVIGLILGVSFGIAIGWLTPDNSRESLLRAVDPGSLAVGIVREVKAVGAEIARDPSQPHATPDQADQEKDRPDGRVIYVLAALGFAVAYLSRYAVTIAFAGVGEDLATSTYAEKHRSTRATARVVVKVLVALVVLFGLGAAEVMLEKSAFDRIVLNDQIERTQELSSAAAPIEAGRVQGRLQEQTAADDDLRKQVALFAAILVLSAYLIYAAGEGYLRGRDSVIRSLVEARMNDLMEQRLAKAGITSESLRSAFACLNRCSVKRVLANGLHLDLAAKQASLQALKERHYELCSLPIEEVPDAHIAARVERAYTDVLGAQIELDKVIGRILDLRYQVLSDLKAEDLRQEADREQKHELRQRQTSDDFERAATAASQKARQQSEESDKDHQHRLSEKEAVHSRLLRDTERQSTHLMEVWVAEINLVRSILSWIEEKIAADRDALRGKPLTFIEKLRGLFRRGGAEPAQATTSPAVLARIEELREELQEIEKIIGDLLKQNVTLTPDQSRAIHGQIDDLLGKAKDLAKENAPATAVVANGNLGNGNGSAGKPDEGHDSGATAI